MSMFRSVALEGRAWRETHLTVYWGVPMAKQPKPHEVTVRQGDDLRVIVEVVDQDGGPIDIQSVQEIRWGAAQKIGAPMAIFKDLTSAEIILGGENAFFLDIRPADTQGLSSGRYYHEAEIVTAEGRTYTVVSGALVIRPQLVSDGA